MPQEQFVQKLNSIVVPFSDISLELRGLMFELISESGRRFDKLQEIADTQEERLIQHKLEELHLP